MISGIKKIKRRSIPIYQEIKDVLREGIMLNQTELLSESRIIHSFKVSNITARRVLNELEEEGLLERKVGVGSIVIPFSEKKAKDLGVIFSHIYDPRQSYISEIVKGIEERAQDKGYHLHLYTTRNRPIGRNHHSTLFHLISRKKIAGLLLLSSLPISDLKFLQRERIPLVVTSNDYLTMKVSTVLFDYKKGIKGVGKRLLKLGYRRMGVITGPKGKGDIQRSGDFVLAGYQEFLKEHNLPYDERLFKAREHCEEEGYQAMAEFYHLPEKDRPQAIIASSNRGGRGALKFIKENNDWQPFIILHTEEEMDSPPYVFAPYKEMGRTAFNLLEKHMEDYTAKQEKILVPLKPIFPQNEGGADRSKIR